MPSSDSKDPNSPTLWQKAFLRDAQWRKDELRALVFWLILAFSLFLGLFYGIAGFHGLPCFVSFFVAVVAVPSIYWTSFLGVDDADYGGKMELLGDSVGTGVAMFVLAWVTMYSALHAS
ncbi:hypothetical protein GGI04_002583 [Coemansia thaxteri]|uniref:Rab5-interacting n=1 Tax=Coemansia thaxteri TaxID=2663907 RepID=A0A9W8BF53_9FUNG|nr:hypothetical protein H4R26_004966 [Coemansia thaxteri]KAJ2004509.1 hypothetical protein GGI04_002583 [Coemansia thaxteri]KAJ2458134.1 hypothetical protein GGI02_006045 [Coemansia sp. RSA 2322]KAJ2478589.1 hypothetical protein EV174_004266 [Coemansia sp. RSA 2320]